MRKGPTSGTYPWSFVTQIFHNGQPSRGSDSKTLEVMTSITSFVTRLARRVPLVVHELLTLPEHLSASRFLVGFVLLDL
jgi:hypothetical protein